MGTSSRRCVPAGLFSLQPKAAVFGHSSSQPSFFFSLTCSNKTLLWDETNNRVEKKHLKKWRNLTDIWKSFVRQRTSSLLIINNAITDRDVNGFKLHCNKRDATTLSYNFTEAISDSILWLSIKQSAKDRKNSGRFNLLVMNILMWMFWRKKISFIVIFVDLSKAFNTVNRETLKQI